MNISALCQWYIPFSVSTWAPSAQHFTDDQKGLVMNFLVNSLATDEPDLLLIFYDTHHMLHYKSWSCSLLPFAGPLPMSRSSAGETFTRQYNRYPSWPAPADKMHRSVSAKSVGEGANLPHTAPAALNRKWWLGSSFIWAGSWKIILLSFVKSVSEDLSTVYAGWSRATL